MTSASDQMPVTQSETLRTGELYNHKPYRGAQRASSVNKYWQEYRSMFPEKSDMVRYLDALTMPASGGWTFGRIPKNGTTTVLSALHYLEFGTPLTAQVEARNNTNEDNAPHMLDQAGVFMSPIQTDHSPKTIKESLRLTVLRNPAERALSSFKYLCRSQELKTTHFAPLRLRIAAISGLDWQEHLYAPAGFNRFLDYIEINLTNTSFPLDRHIAPQTYSLPRDIFKPYMIGRTEDMKRFLIGLADEFEDRLPQHILNTHNNANVAELPFRLTRATLTRLEDLFAQDYEWYESE